MEIKKDISEIKVKQEKIENDQLNIEKDNLRAKVLKFASEIRNSIKK